jgi:uncharacterized protein
MHNETIDQMALPEPVSALRNTDDNLTPLNPHHITVSRISTAIVMIFPIIGAIAGEVANFLPRGACIIPVLLIAAYFVFIVPVRKYKNWGYHFGPDRLRVVSGYLFHSDTVVPFGRVQHIDVDQGPLQRPYGLATLTLHTAGNHNSTVALPGLAHEDALKMREAIRSKIRRDAL